jgi:hypothetical protein
MKRSSSFWLLGLLTASTAVALAAAANVKRPDLTGVVKGRNGGPISGASAFIYTAGPKLGIGFL